MYSTTQGGLSKADFDNLRRVFILNYGYQEMVTLMNLQDAGLFRQKLDKKQPGYFDWNWEKIKTTFNLIDENMNRHSPSDISYVYNGYSPISVRLIEFFIEHKGISTL